MYLNTNLSATFAEGALGTTLQSLDATESALATGSTLTSPATDPSASAMESEFGGQLGVTTQGLANVAQAQDWLNTASGALQSAMQIADQMEQIAVQASNNALSTTDWSDLQDQMNALVQQLGQISTQTQYNQQPIFYNPVLTPSAATVPQNGLFTTPLPANESPIPLVYWSQLPTFVSTAFQAIPLTGNGGSGDFWLPYTANNAGLGTFLTQNTFVATATTTLNVSASADDGALMYVDGNPVAFGSIDAGEPNAIVAAGLPMPPASNTITVGPGLHTVTLEAYNIGGPAGIGFHVTNASTGQVYLSNGSITGWRSTEYFRTPPAGSYATPGVRTIDSVGLAWNTEAPDTPLTTWHVNVTNEAITTGSTGPPSMVLPALPQLDALNSGTVYSVGDVAEAQTTQTFIQALRQQISNEQTQVGTTLAATQAQAMTLTQQATATQQSQATVGSTNLAQATAALAREQVLAQTGIQMLVSAQRLHQQMAQWLKKSA